MKDVLVTLRELKRKMAEMSPKVDMWCHFGTVTVFVPDHSQGRFLSPQDVHHRDVHPGM